jgi:formate hydrogenlyase subunit 6/NADH:ubiquinone oxidoreductase subunit I
MRGRSTMWVWVCVVCQLCVRIQPILLEVQQRCSKLVVMLTPLVLAGG